MSKIQAPKIKSGQRGSVTLKPPETSKKEDKKIEPPKEKKFTLPAMSIPPPKAKREEKINWDNLKMKSVRRDVPAGEKKAELAKIIKSLASGPKITVHEYINLVSSVTGDNGETMRIVMEEDLASFRKLVKKIYDTMTQDVSDVLVNEQMQLTEFYQERFDVYNDKLMRLINEIYGMVPEFNFELYYKDKENYLNMVLPLPKAVQREEEDIEMQRRQEAFHRVAWLKVEGERLAEENTRLQKKLTQLKRQQTEEQRVANRAIKEAEERKKKLESEEAERSFVFNTLNDSMGKSMVRNEAIIKKKDTAKAVKAGAAAKARAVAEAAAEGPSAATGAIRKKTVPGDKKKKKKRAKDWLSATAADMEEDSAMSRLAAEAKEAKEKRRQAMKRMDPFRSPTPEKKESSPFHFSPTRSPEPADPWARYKKPPVVRSTTVEHNTSTVQTPRQPIPSGRRAQAPRDSWGGFG